MSPGLRIVAVAGVIVVSAAATVLVLGAVGGGDETTLPAPSDPVPVIAPVASSDVLSRDAASAPAGGGASSAGAGSAEESGTGSSAAGAGDSVAADALPVSPIVSEEGFSTSAAGDVVRRFFDVCALGGRSAALECLGAPRPHVPGTILGPPREETRPGIPMAIVAPFQILAVRAYPAGDPVCRFGHLSETDVPLEIDTNNPAEFTVTYNNGRSLLEPAPVMVSTSAAQRDAWTGWVDAETNGLVYGNVVHTCATLPGAVPSPGQEQRITVTGTDDAHFSGTAAITIAGPRARPDRRPVELTPRPPSRLLVRAPTIPGDEETASIRVVPVDPEHPGGCLGVERAGRHTVRDPRAEEYFVEGGDVQRAVLRLDPGQQYWVCIWWTRGGEIVERERHLVTTPSAYVPVVTPIQLDVREPAAGDTPDFGTFEIRDDHNRRFCVQALPKLAPGLHDLDLNPCEVSPPEGGALASPSLGLYVKSPSGDQLSVRNVRVPARCDHCVDATYAQTFNLEVPQVQGRGNRARLVQIGVLNVRIEWNLVGHSPEWRVDPARAFTATDPVGDPTPYPLLVSGEAVGSPSSFAEIPGELTVTLHTDRPTIAGAFVYDPVTGPPCLQGGTGLADSGPARSEHVIHLDGLCQGTAYLVGVALVDPDTEAQSFYGTRPPGGAPPGPVVGGPLFGSTGARRVPIHVRLELIDLPDAAANGLRDLRFEVLIHGVEPIRYALPSSECARAGEQFDTVTDPDLVAGASETLTVRVTVTGHVVPVDAGSHACDPATGPPHTLSIIQGVITRDERGALSPVTQSFDSLRTYRARVRLSIDAR
jgi:hypothetical protein